MTHESANLRGSENSSRSPRINPPSLLTSFSRISERDMFTGTFREQLRTPRRIKFAHISMRFGETWNVSTSLSAPRSHRPKCRASSSDIGLQPTGRESERSRKHTKRFGDQYHDDVLQRVIKIALLARPGPQTSVRADPAPTRKSQSLPSGNAEPRRLLDGNVEPFFPLPHPTRQTAQANQSLAIPASGSRYIAILPSCR